MPVKDDGSIDLAAVPRRTYKGGGAGPGKDGAALQVRSARLAMMDPVPQGLADPVGWAEKHAEQLAPDAIKEVEYAMKFGSDERRYIAARDILAMKGLTTKPKEQANIQQAMVFNVTGPMTASGAPVMPFSNAAPALAPGVQTVAPAAQPVTTETSPAEKDTK